VRSSVKRVAPFVRYLGVAPFTRRVQCSSLVRSPAAGRGTRKLRTRAHDGRRLPDFLPLGRSARGRTPRRGE
jgi:hypothetical protein